MDTQKAFQEAKINHKHILLNFSGSDWCGPCIKLHKDVFQSASFNNIAETNLILINADFPRSKKNQLTKEQQTINDQLAEKYNPKGNFPFTLLLNENGDIIKSWDGYPKDIHQFLDELNQMVINQ